MSDSADTSAAPVAPAETPTPAQSAPVAPTAPTASTPARVEMSSDDLKKRFDEERRKAAERAVEDTLKALGAANLNEAKAALEAKRKLDDEKRTELERKDREIDALKPKATRAELLESVLKEQVDGIIAALTDEQRAAVEDLSGGDPAQALRVINKLRPTWAKPAPVVEQPAPVAQPATQPVVQQPLPPPTNTAPPRAPSPGDVQPSGPVDHLKIWEDLKATNPFKAAAYLMLNEAEIFAARNARSA